MTNPNTGMLGGSVLYGSALARDHEFFDDFTEGGYGTTLGAKFASTADVAPWLYTSNGGATATFIISDAEPGGVLACSAGAATDNHGWDMQLNGEAWAVTDGKDLYWEARWKSRTSVTDIDWVIGLTDTDTSVLAGCAQALVFRSGAVDTAPLNAGNADIIATAGDDMGGSWTDSKISEVDSGVNLVADTYVVTSCLLQVRGSTKRAQFFVNGANVLNTTSNIPDTDTALTFNISGQNNGSTNTFVQEVDYVYITQKR